MDAPASDWLRHFRLLLWNSWMEFNETKWEARWQSHLLNLCFSARIGKRRWPPGFWLAESFSISPLKPMNGIQRNLTGSKISLSFTFVFLANRKANMVVLANLSRKVAHYTHVHDIWPFGTLVWILCWLLSWDWVRYLRFPYASAPHYWDQSFPKAWHEFPDFAFRISPGTFLV